MTDKITNKALKTCYEITGIENVKDTYLEILNIEPDKNLIIDEKSTDFMNYMFNLLVDYDTNLSILKTYSEFVKEEDKPVINALIEVTKNEYMKRASKQFDKYKIGVNDEK